MEALGWIWLGGCICNTYCIAAGYRRSGVDGAALGVACAVLWPMFEAPLIVDLLRGKR